MQCHVFNVRKDAKLEFDGMMTSGRGDDMSVTPTWRDDPEKLERCPNQATHLVGKLPVCSEHLEGMREEHPEVYARWKKKKQIKPLVIDPRLS